MDNVSLGTASSTTVPNWWRSCEANCEIATARQLNQTGVDESIAIGQAFDDHGIPVGRVLSSEYCRCFTTAELMDFGPPIELEQGLSLFVYSDVIDRCEATKEFIREVPAAGTNTAVIGHTGFTCTVVESEPASNLGALEWAEAAIFKPDGDGGVEYVVRLMGDEWAGLPD
jgi:phosphohistidine phosphatase SixA